MNDGALVSAVIPTYNYGHFICESVESALAQTWPNMEVIVVDDGSTDDTRQRLTPYLSRIRYIHQENAGLSAARNTGIKAALGEWVALLDADDLWHPDKTRVQLASLPPDSDVALVGSPASPTPCFQALPNPAAHQIKSVRDLLLSLSFGPSSVLLQKKCFDGVGYFDTSLRSVEDRDMWLRFATRFKCVVVDAACWWYRPHSGQMSRNSDRMLSNYRRVLDKFFLENPAHRRFRRPAMSYMYFDSAWPTFGERRPLKALQRLAQSTARCPLSLGDPTKPKWIRCKLAARILLRRFP